jgi:DNA-binding transcriptional MerR regulator
MVAREWKLDELADEAGVSPRTIRYYVQRGLLPAPTFRGRDTAYGEEHLARLRAIKRLQERFLPLDEIESQLARRTLDEIEVLASALDEVAPIVAKPAKAARVEPAPSRAGSSATHAATHVTRYTLGPGLELHLDDHADDATKKLAHDLIDLAQKGRTR